MQIPVIEETNNLSLLFPFPFFSVTFSTVALWNLCMEKYKEEVLEIVFLEELFLFILLFVGLYALFSLFKHLSQCFPFLFFILTCVKYSMFKHNSGEHHILMVFT